MLGSRARPDWTFRSYGRLEYYDPRGEEIIARQQLETLYHRNGAADAITRECLLEQKTTKAEKTGAVVIEDKTVSIDTLRDFKLAEFVLDEANDHCCER